MKKVIGIFGVLILICMPIVFFAVLLLGGMFFALSKHIDKEP